MVYVNAGDSKGQQGKVLKVDAQKQRAIVEGVTSARRLPSPMRRILRVVSSNRSRRSTFRICRFWIRRAANPLVSVASRMRQVN